MARIQIPGRLDEHLGDSLLGHALRLYVHQVDKWVGDDTKGLFFFPEYTDHGPRHINSVLAGAESLIHPGAWKVLTPEDILVLVASVVLHDLSMHLSSDGFLFLIDPMRASERLVHRLDQKSWPELFETYFAEARRWDQRRLHRILGDQSALPEKEPDLINYVQHPNDAPDPETWSVRYRKFLGEFVRRNHARIAHEIALFGFPGHTQNVLLPPDELGGLADLVGLVARSHNMNLRDTFVYLQEKYYGRVTCRNVHPVFLMVVLRIADYLEIRADRVNPTAFQIQRLRSPISLEEYVSHLAMHEVRLDEHDDEALFVIAKPATSHLFQKTYNLLRNLQIEFDTSWAVLGEVYSRYADLSCLGIKLRRVHSNLDIPGEFLRREEPTYFPVSASFDATADLLKILIKPLYGNRPEIGVRELLQNAIDAVQELRQWAQDHGDPAMEKIPLPQQKSDVEICIGYDDCITIRDKGIGMTADVIRNYFLKAGASYRESTAWRESFTKKDGGSKVARSGRFGIGALAAFLLGDRVEVTTRHASAPADSGISFSASIMDDFVELRRIRLVEVGTTVKIKLTEHAIKELKYGFKWDWYTADDPSVQRIHLLESLEQKYHIPSEGGPDWTEIPIAEYKSVIWNFATENLVYSCNGIIVKDRKEMPSDWHGFPIGAPSVSVVDLDGRLPLNLQRDQFVSTDSTEFPLFREVLNDMVCELGAFLLSWGPNSSRGFIPVKNSIGSKNWPALFSGCRELRGAALWPIFYTHQGVALVNEWTLISSNKHFLIFIVKDPEIIGIIPQSDKAAHGFCFDKGLREDAKPIKDSLGRLVGGDLVRFRILEAEKKLGYREIGQALAEGWHIREALPRVPLNFDGRKVEARVLGPSSQILEDLCRDLIGKVACSDLKVMELTFEDQTMFPRSKIMRTTNHRPESWAVSILSKIFDVPVIPFDYTERRRQLPRAFQRLEKHLERWKPENLAGWRMDLVNWFLEGDRTEGEI